MTTRAAEDVRLKPVRPNWNLGASWLTGKVLGGTAAVLVVLLFGGLLWTLRERPLPRPRVDFPPPPQLNVSIAAAQEKLKANPQDIAALVELGTLLFEKGKDSYLESINALEEARDLGALDPRIFYCLGVMYQEEGLYPFAITEYKRFLRHYPEDREVRMLAAKLYYRMGLFPEAVGEYERLKFLSPEDPLIEENLGLSLWAAKQLDRAGGSFMSLKSSGGDFARRADFYLGQLALEAGKFQEAFDHFTQAIGDGAPIPGLPVERLQTGLAMAAQKLSRWDEAQKAWEAVLRAVPGDAKAQAALREATRRAQSAKKAAEKAAAAAEKAAAAKKK